MTETSTAVEKKTFSALQHEHKERLTAQSQRCVIVSSLAFDGDHKTHLEGYCFVEFVVWIQYNCLTRNAKRLNIGLSNIFVFDNQEKGRATKNKMYRSTIVIALLLLPPNASTLVAYAQSSYSLGTDAGSAPLC